VRHQIDDSRKAGVQVALRIHQCRKGVMWNRLRKPGRSRPLRSDPRTTGRRQRIARHRMQVGVDETRKHGCAAQIDDVRACGNRYIRSDVDDAIATHDDDLIGTQRS